MAVLLANCTHQKWQERRLAQKWTKANLSKAETYARELEMAQLLTKEVRSTGEGRVNAVRLETKCGNCGVHHEPGFCKAKGKICFKCQRIGHFRKLCRSTCGRNRKTTEVQMLEDTHIRVGLVAVHPTFGEEEVEIEDADKISIVVTIDHSIKTIFGNITIKISNKTILQINEM